jgi:hypothetical protein
MANGQRHSPGSVCHEGRVRMPATKLVFSLHNLHHGWWQAVLSDGLQEAIITASAVPEEPLLPLLWAVRLLLLGANASQCTWWGEPGQYRWLFSRTEQQVQIHIVWFADHQQWSDDKGKTMLRLECNLLTFAKRLSHQFGQLEYQNESPAVAPQEYQHLKEALLTYEQKQPDNGA